MSNVVFCSKCGSENKSTRKNCDKCGEYLLKPEFFKPRSEERFSYMFSSKNNQNDTLYEFR